MIKVECYSGYKFNERPMAFSLMGHSYRVKEIIDTWYSEAAVYFKIKADDDNLYLLKYDEDQDQWDLVFFQNPQKVNILLPPESRVKSPLHPDCKTPGFKGKDTVH